MKQSIIKTIKKGMNLFRYTTKKKRLDDEKVIYENKNFMDIYYKCRPFTITGIECIYALYQATKYITNAGIDGDFVECGVWKGGSAMVIAYTLIEQNNYERKIFLYDTYLGMAKPSNEDYSFNESSNTHDASIEIWKKNQKKNYNNWCYSSIKEVKRNMKSTNYPIKNIIFIKGKVENTIPKIIPKNISLLRLDTDWYESTKHELNYLFPLLTINGVLIIDDYGFWKGQKKAVDEYFRDNKIPILLNRVDIQCRLGLKIK